jgi:hypothetical protein
MCECVELFSDGYVRLRSAKPGVRWIQLSFAQSSPQYIISYQKLLRDLRNWFHKLNTAQPGK